MSSESMKTRFGVLSTPSVSQRSCFHFPKCSLSRRLLHSLECDVSDYFSPRSLAFDKYFWIRLLSAIAASAIFVAVVAFALVQGRFVVAPIATVTLASPKDGTVDAHILSTAEFVALTNNSNKSVSIAPGTKVQGYVTNFDDVCQLKVGVDKKNLVITKSNNSVIIGFAGQNQNNCRNAANLSASDSDTICIRLSDSWGRVAADYHDGKRHNPPMMKVKRVFAANIPSTGG